MTPDAAVIEPEIIEAEPLALQLSEQINSLIVNDEETSQRAGAVLRECAARVKILEALRIEEKAKILEAGRDCDRRWNGRKAPYLKIIDEIKPELQAYLDEQRRIQEEAERIANEAAEKERLRLEALARENERKAAEARAAGDEGKAEKYEAKADMQAEQAATVPVLLPPPTPKVAGVTAARPWKGRCTNLGAMLFAAVNAEEPTRTHARRMLRIEYSQAAGNDFARSNGGAVKVPGYIAEQVTEIQGR